MALGNKTLSVTGAATAVLVYSGGGPETRQTRVLVSNTSANTVHLGGTSAVNATTGVPMATATTREIVLNSGESLYVFAAVTSVITALANGQ